MGKSIKQLEVQGQEARSSSDPAATAAQMKDRWSEVAFVNQLLERDSFRWTRLLDQLEAHSLSGVVLRSINPDVKQDKLTISGYARELSHLRKFIDRLISSGDYKDVYLLSQGLEKIEDSDGRERKAVSFVIELYQGI